MSHGLSSFVVEIPVNDSAAMADFQRAMDAVEDETNNYISKLAKELAISECAADDVYYLRTRSYHTQEKEDYIIEMHRSEISDLAILSGEEWDKPRFLEWATKRRGVNPSSLIGERTRESQARFDAIKVEVKTDLGIE